MILFITATVGLITNTTRHLNNKERFVAQDRFFIYMVK